MPSQKDLPVKRNIIESIVKGKIHSFPHLGRSGFGRGGGSSRDSGNRSGGSSRTSLQKKNEIKKVLAFQKPSTGIPKRFKKRQGLLSYLGHKGSTVFALRRHEKSRRLHLGERLGHKGLRAHGEQRQGE